MLAIAFGFDRPDNWQADFDGIMDVRIHFKLNPLHVKIKLLGQRAKVGNLTVPFRLASCLNTLIDFNEIICQIKLIHMLAFRYMSSQLIFIQNSR